MTDLTQCPHCHLPHANPCDDTRKIDCLIWQAQQKVSKERETLANDPTAVPTMNPEHVAELERLVAAVTPPPPPLGGRTSKDFRALDASGQPIDPLPAAPGLSDAINPTHYTRFKIQPIVFIRENNLPFWQANVVKYVVRADAKNGIEDIDKAIDYLMKERAYLSGDQNWTEVRWAPPTSQAK